MVVYSVKPLEAVVWGWWKPSKLAYRHRLRFLLVHLQWIRVSSARESKHVMAWFQHKANSAKKTGPTHVGMTKQKGSKQTSDGKTPHKTVDRSKEQAQLKGGGPCVWNSATKVSKWVGRKQNQTNTDIKAQG